jgi:ElaA protein
MIEWHWLAFDDIPRADWYEVLRQRQAVFILEQTCLYPDIDGADPQCHHLMGWREIDGERTLVTYLRVVPPGLKFDEMSLGRVLTTQAGRGTGVGRELLAKAIPLAEKLHPGWDIRIGAQAHLEKFYGSFGFQTVTDPYDEDGIMHVDMVRTKTSG